MKAFRDHKFSDDAKGRFSIVSVDYNSENAGGDLPFRYGVSDESGRINVNALMHSTPSRRHRLSNAHEAAGYDRRHRLCDHRLD